MVCRAARGNVHDVVVRSAFVLQHDVQYCTGQRVHNCYCLGRKGDVCTGRLVKMHESTCVAQGFEPEATAAASEATAATSEVPVASSGVREEDYPSGLRNSRPAHLRKVRVRAHARDPTARTARAAHSQGVCLLGSWGQKNGQIKRFLRLLETQMLYVFDDTPSEVDPYELRKPQSRVLGAAVNRVRANQ